MFIYGVINKTLSTLSKRFNIDLHYFAKGGFWLLLTQGITIIGSLVSTAIFAHVLTSSDFGLYRYLISLAVLFTTFSLTGMAQSILQTAAKGYVAFFQYGVRKSLIYSLGIFITSLIGAGYYLYSGNADLAIGCVLIAVLQPFISSFQNVVPFLQGLKKFKESAKVQIFKVSFITIASTAVVFLSENVLFLLSAFLISQVLANVLSALFFSAKYAEGADIDESTKERYLDYARHISLQNVISGIASRLDNILVFQFLGASSLAVFVIATVVPDQVRGAFKNLIPLLIPKLAKYQRLSDLPFFLERSFQFFLISAVGTLVLVLMIPFVYEIFFPKYLIATKYSQLLLMSLPANVMLLPLSALQSHLKEKELYHATTIGAIFQIIVTVFLIPFLGIWGAISARIVSRYFLAALYFFYFFRIKD